MTMDNSKSDIEMSVIIPNKTSNTKSLLDSSGGGTKRSNGSGLGSLKNLLSGGSTKTIYTAFKGVTGETNDDGTIKTADNNSDAVKQVREEKKSSYSLDSEKEITGDNPDSEMMQFEPCKYNNKKCKYADVYGVCVAENCLFDNDEKPTLTESFFTECIICKNKFKVNPRNMKAYICPSCIERIQRTEVLPFTCVHCGKKQNHPSKIPMSGICDDCFDHELFNDQYTVKAHTYVRKETNSTPTTNHDLM